jgi:hypothetical protein
MQSRVDRIIESPQLARMQELEQKARTQSGGDAGYLNEQCAVLQE